MYFALYVCLMEEICEKVENLQFNCADCRKLVRNKIPVKSCVFYKTSFWEN